MEENENNLNKTELGRFIEAPHYIRLNNKIIEVYEKVEFITHKAFRSTFLFEDLIICLN